MKKLFTLLILISLISPFYSFLEVNRRGASSYDYLDYANRIARTIEKYGVDKDTGLIASHVDVANRKPLSLDTLGWAGWSLCGLWSLYWETGNKSILRMIENHSNAFWTYGIHPIGLPYYKFDLELNKGEGNTVGYRIQYQTHALGNWDAYLCALEAAMKYQVKEDARGLRTVVMTLDGDKPYETSGLRSPGYFGCLDLRIPYVNWVISDDESALNIIKDDFSIHRINSPTGLWHSEIEFKDKNLLVGKNIWMGCIADNTYCGLIFYDLTKDEWFLDFVKKQTDLALKYGFDENKNYFVNKVDVRTGNKLDLACRWHTNWEWCLTLLILGEYTHEEKYLEYANRNYDFLIENIANPGNWAQDQGGDWNLPQVGLLSLFRYHQTGEKRFLEDAFKVGKFIVKHRLRIVGDEVWVGRDKLMSLRDAGDTIAFFVSLANPSHPIFSARYFLFPVGINSPSFPIFRHAYVDRFYSTDSGKKIFAKIVGGEKKEKADAFVMVLSGKITKVKVNGELTNWETLKVGDQRFVKIGEVPLANAEIEIGLS
jgi:hypothetical protein